MELTDQQQTLIRCAVREQIRNLTLELQKSPKWEYASKQKEQLEQILVLFLQGEIEVRFYPTAKELVSAKVAEILRGAK